jgi:hypothetical protein
MLNRERERRRRTRLCMNARRVALALGLTGLMCVSAAPAAPAAAGDERRGSVPPGTSQDGSGPSAGAIKGGSIESKDTADPDDSKRQEVERCRDLTGTLRSQCLADARIKDTGRPASK